MEVEVEHRRAFTSGIHSVSSQLEDEGRRDKKIMGVVELPFEVDPALAANSTASSVDRNSSPPLTHKFLRRGKDYGCCRTSF
jgi:hypothetical protein